MSKRRPRIVLLIVDKDASIESEFGTRESGKEPTREDFDRAYAALRFLFGFKKKRGDNALWNRRKTV